jgi:hypothetical protein
MFVPSAFAQPTKRVILQMFWWEGRAGGGIGPGYRNDNYPLGWFNYLADLAPRLHSIGIDAVWIPPTVKNAVGAACLVRTGTKIRAPGDRLVPVLSSVPPICAVDADLGKASKRFTADQAGDR